MKSKIYAANRSNVLIVVILIVFCQGCTRNWNRWYISSNDDCMDLNLTLDKVFNNPKSLIVLNFRDEEPQKFYLEGGFKLRNYNASEISISAFDHKESQDLNYVNNFITLEFNGSVIQIQQLDNYIKKNKGKWNSITISGPIDIEIFNVLIPSILNKINHKIGPKIYVDPEGTCVKILYRK